MAHATHTDQRDPTMPDFAHLDALNGRLHRETMRLAEAQQRGDVRDAAYREREIAACQREIRHEREFLGIGEEQGLDLSHDELLAELLG